MPGWGDEQQYESTGWPSPKQMSGWGDEQQYESTGWPSPKQTPAFGTTVCKYFLQNTCLRGKSCHYRHSRGGNTPVSRAGNRWGGADADHSYQNGVQRNANYEKTKKCIYFSQGKCNRGESCTYRHDIVENRYSDLPTAISRPCHHYNNGYCAKGDACRFLHSEVSDDPQSTSRHEWTRSDASPVFSYAGHAESSNTEDHSPCQFYPEGKCARRRSCPFAHGDEDVRAMGSTKSRAPVICQMYMMGKCSRNSECPFFHPRVVPIPADDCEIVVPCRFYGEGKCFRGDDCPFGHSDVDSGWTHNDAPPRPLVRLPSLNSPQKNRSRFQRAPVEKEAPADFAVSSPVDHHSEKGWHTGGWPDSGWPSEPPPFEPSSDPCKLYPLGQCSQGSNCPHRHIDPEPSGSQTERESGDTSTQPTAENTVTDTWGVYTYSSWDQPIDRPPLTEDAIPEPRNCEYCEQGTCMEGTACAVKYNNPPVDSWSTNNYEASNDWFASQDNPVVETEPLDCVPVTEFTVERFVYDSNVRFGEGAKVKTVTTFFESSRLILSNLPSDVEIRDVVDLVKPSGVIAEVVVEKLPSSSNAQIVFAECADASQAVQKLHDMLYRSTVLNARLDLPDGPHVTKAENLLNRKIKISWPSPSLVGWAHYPSVSQAKKEANDLNGQKLGGRKIAAVYQAPKKKQTHSYTVQLKNLPLGTTRQDIQDFCSGTSSTTVDVEASYDRDTSIQHVHELLTVCGSLDSFDVLPVEPNIFRIIAFAEFGCAENAAAAVEKLSNNKHDFLRGNKLSIEQILSTKHSIPLSQFIVLKTDLDQLRETHDDLCKIRYYDRNEEGQPTDPVRVRIYGIDPRAVGRARKAVGNLLRGRPLLLEHNNDWDENFGTAYDVARLTNRNTDTKYFVGFDTRMRTLRYFSQEIPLEDARDIINRDLKLIRARHHTIPIERTAVRSLLTDVLQSFRDDAIDTNLDVINLTLTIQGETGDVKKVKRALTELTTSFQDVPRSTSDTGDLCPVCFRDADTPITLSCGHIYCETCLGHLIHSASVPSFSPLKCMAASRCSEDTVFCDADIPFDIIRNILSPSEETKLLKYSFMSFLRLHPDDLIFCPTPDCHVVHRQTDAGIIFRCPSCHLEFCPNCHVEFHDGLSCVEWQDLCE